MLQRLLKHYRLCLAWENYLLLARAIAAARLVRRALPEKDPGPNLGPAIAAAEKFYLPPQPGWMISDPRRIPRFAALVANYPRPWGRCVQQSLIAYRLLNGYGIPAKICYGISRARPRNEGHAWIEPCRKEDAAILGEHRHDREFQLVYQSPLPTGQ